MLHSQTIAMHSLLEYEKRIVCLLTGNDGDGSFHVDPVLATIFQNSRFPLLDPQVRRTTELW